MAQKITKMHLKRAVSAFLAVATAITTTPPITISAEEAEKYPYTLFAGSYSEGAITTTAGNFCVNGNVATNGTIVAAGNMNINGTKTENAGEEMIYIFNKIESKYFSGNNVDEYAEDYTLEEMNINVTEPLEVGGEIEMTGNINLTTAIKAYDTVFLNGEVKNTSESVICSETGDIIIDCTNVNLNGLVYAPDGSVEITAQNLNLNNVIIIADTILLDCPNVNANYGSSVAEFVGTESEKTGKELFIDSLGKVNREISGIDVFWNSSVPEGTFDIEVSIDNTEYEILDSVKDCDSFSFIPDSDFDTLYVRVTQTTNYGESISATPFVVKNENGTLFVEFLDTDGDGLDDVDEAIFGSDISKADTDEDGLTDSDEVFITNSNPVVFDSITSGTSDGENDLDDDSLSNKDEIAFNTDVTSPDTDNDGLNDYDEIYIWNTDPLIEDTDNDTIIDGDEVKIGLTPTNPETFGYPDAEYKSVQIISADSTALAVINNEDSPYTLSLEVTASGCVETNIKGSESSFAATMKNDFMVGNSFELTYFGEHNVDNIKLSFEMSEDYLAEAGDIRKHNIFKYFEDDNMLLPIATYFDVDSNTIYTDVNEFGTYCLMDAEAWLEFLENVSETVSTYDVESATPMLMSIKRTYAAEETLDTSGGFEVEETEENYEGEVLVDSVSIDYLSSVQYGSLTIEIDDSKKDSPIDLVFILQSAGVSEAYFNDHKDYISSVSEIMFDNHTNVRVKVVNYYVNYASSGGWFTDLSSLDIYLDGLSYTTSYEYCDRSKAFKILMESTSFRDEASKFAFHFINGNTTANESMIDHIYMCKELNINFSEFPPIGWYYNSSLFAQMVVDSIAATDGIYERFEYMDEGRLYGHIIDHTLKPRVLFTAIIPSGWKVITLEDSLTPDSLTDTDKDGLTDWYEIDETQIELDETGEIIYPSVRACYLRDRGSIYRRFLDSTVKNEYLVNNKNYTADYIDYLFTKVTALPLDSDPTSEDGDEDGLLDNEERTKISEGKTIVVTPIDANPLRVDGPLGIWQQRIKDNEEYDIPTRTEKWYGETQLSNFIPNIGVEGFAAFVEELAMHYAEFKVYSITMETLSNSVEFYMEHDEYLKAATRVLFMIAITYEYIPNIEEAKAIAASLGSRFLNFKMDDMDMALHSQHKTWQAVGGYSNLYDSIFHFFTGGNMDAIKLPFTLDIAPVEFFEKYNIDSSFANDLLSLDAYGFCEKYGINLDIIPDFIETPDTELIIWGWRGDYLNLGAGAEVGLYFRPSTISAITGLTDHYFTEIELTVPMTLYLYNHEDNNTFSHILSWEPIEEQWWITGFNPQTIGQACVEKQVMICSIDFSEFGMENDENSVYKAIKLQIGEDETKEKFVFFDDKNEQMWIIWYGGSSI